jgi:hypothetical protein
MSRSDLDLATIRDVYENLHLAAREPEGVCYSEVDINGVPALWCVPTDCKLLTRPILEWFRETWLGDTDTAWHDPRVNLLYADLAGLPPIQVYYGDHELLVGEIIEFATRAKDAGVDVSLHSVSEGQHNFILGAGRVPEVDEAIEQMAQWLRSRLSSVKGGWLETSPGNYNTAVTTFCIGKEGSDE